MIDLMPAFHRGDFSVHDFHHFCLISAINKQLHALFEKFIGHILTLKRHHAVFSGDRCQFN
jgi:hypothetical protein